MVRQHHMDGELPLELPVGLLLGAAARDEGSERGQGERLVGRRRRVLEVPVIRGEEIELEVLPGLVPDPLAVDDHAEDQVPELQLQSQYRLEGADLGRDIRVQWRWRLRRPR